MTTAAEERNGASDVTRARENRRAESLPNTTACAAQTLTRANRERIGPLVPWRQLIFCQACLGNPLATSNKVLASGKSFKAGYCRGRPVGLRAATGAWAGSLVQTFVLGSTATAYCNPRSRKLARKSKSLP